MNQIIERLKKVRRGAMFIIEGPSLSLIHI